MPYASLFAKKVYFFEATISVRFSLMKIIIIKVLLFVSFFPVVVPAAHVTDKLLVGIYTSADTSSKLLKLVESGTPLDVLETDNGFSKVRLGDGVEGWIEKSYVTEEKPAKAILLETQAKLAAMKNQQGRCDKNDVAPLGEKTETASGREVELERQVISLKKKMREVATILSFAVNDGEVRLGKNTAGDNSEDAHSEDDEQFQRYWPWVAMLITAALGFAGGVAFFDYKVRKRYGGFRL